MKHVFTNREKILLVILAIMLIAVGYWKLILTPINDDIADLQSRTASEQDAMIQSAAPSPSPLRSAATPRPGPCWMPCMTASM